MPSPRSSIAATSSSSATFPSTKLFERSCELGLWRLTADKITEIFGTRLNRRMRGKLATVIDRIEHGHHVFRAYFKNAFLKQYEKFATLPAQRTGLHTTSPTSVLRRDWTISMPFASASKPSPPASRRFQAQWLNVHGDFPLLQRLALPITIGAVRYPGIKIHNPRVIRLLEVLAPCGSHVGGWTAKPIHPRRPHHLPPLRQRLRPQPTALRPAQAEGPRAVAA